MLGVLFFSCGGLSSTDSSYHRKRYDGHISLAAVATLVPVSTGA